MYINYTPEPFFCFLKSAVLLGEKQTIPVCILAAHLACWESVIGENGCTFIVFNYNKLQTIIAMFAEDNVTELFSMADGFCKFFEP